MPRKYPPDAAAKNRNLIRDRKYAAARYFKVKLARQRSCHDAGWMDYVEVPRERYATTDNEFLNTYEELEFLRAIDRARRGRVTVPWDEALAVAKSLGWRKG